LLRVFPIRANRAVHGDRVDRFKRAPHACTLAHSSVRLVRTLRDLRSLLLARTAIARKATRYRRLHI